MTILSDHPREVTVGVDTHGEFHVAASLDSNGGVLGVETFANTPSGYRDLLTWAETFGPVGRFGIEGTGSYGAGLVRFLRTRDVETLEACRPNRQLRRRHGKSDSIDAVAAGRAVLSGQVSGPSKTKDGIIEAIRVLRVVKRSAIKDRTAAINQLRALITTAPDDLRAQLSKLTQRKLIDTTSRLRPSSEGADPLAATKVAMRALARRVAHLDDELADLDARLRDLVAQAAPSLLELFAVGPDTASTLLVTAGDNPDRLRSEGAWARLCGVAPVPASTANSQRHRLNRGGERQANSALWRITLIRMKTHAPTRAYVQRRTEEGLSKREIMRCLKRYIAREIYPHLQQVSGA